MSQDSQDRTVQISYVAPVEVVVNLTTQTVERVVVLDDEIKLMRDDVAKDGKSVHTEDYDDVTDPGQRATALTVAENAQWPAWEFGW